MEENNTAPAPAAPASEQPAPEAAGHRPWWRTATIIALILTIIAWVTMIANEYVSLWCAVAAFVLAMAGAIKGGKGSWRNIAITVLVASGALIIVYALFFFGINYALSAI